MTLTESRDPCVSQTAPTLVTGRKWNPTAATHQAKSDLRHRDIIGIVQQGRGGLGLGESRPSWHRAAPAQRRRLGGSWWAWKHFTSASSYVLRMTSCLPPQTSTSGTEKTRLAPSVHPPQTSNTFWLAARQACHKAIIPGGTTMSWNV